MGVLKKFNDNLPIDRKISEEIQSFIEMKEEHDKTLALKKESDLHIFNQLPGFIQNRIYKEFLFEDFLLMFKRVFKLVKPKLLLLTPKPKKPGNHKQALTWDSQVYGEFMIGLLDCLEPRYLPGRMLIQ